MDTSAALTSRPPPHFAPATLCPRALAGPRLRHLHPSVCALSEDQTADPSIPWSAARYSHSPSRSLSHSPGLGEELLRQPGSCWRRERQHILYASIELLDQMSPEAFPLCLCFTYLRACVPLGGQFPLGKVKRPDSCTGDPGRVLLPLGCSGLVLGLQRKAAQELW